VLVLTAALPTIAVAGSATVGGPGTLLPLPSSALAHSIVGDQPADGSTQGYNPPIFKWVYTENPTYTLQTVVRTFKFQLSTNADFSSFYWNITCSNNFYNFLPPITNSDGSTYAGTNFWRIVYMNSNATVNVATGVVHTFVLSPNATPWNRSMLADTNYLLGIATNHPHMWFSQGNLGAMSSFLQRNNWPTYGRNWSSTIRDATQAQSQTWWNTPAITNLSGNALMMAVQDAQMVAFSYYMSGSNSTWDIQGAAGTLNWCCTSILSHGYDQTDPYSFDLATENSLATSYDWLFPFMSSSQRSNVLYTISSIVQFTAYNDWWGYSMVPAVTNRVYTNALTVTYSSAMKLASSHERFCAPVGLEDCIAAMGENPQLLALFPMFMNYSIAQFDPYQGDEGRGYSEQCNFKFDREFGAFALSTVQFPEAKLWMNPVLTNLASFFANWEPVGYQGVFEPWGDLGFGFQSQWFNTRYFDLALLTQNGAVLRQFNRSSVVRFNSPDSSPLLGEAFLPFYYPKPIETDWSDTTYLDLDRGWAMSSAYPPTFWNAFTNGVGFVFQARPAGSRIEHSSFTDGQVELWAYGASCTAGGAAGGYAKHPMYYNGLMVNGIGMMNPQSPISDLYYNQLTQFTNAPDFTYTAGDLTKGFNRSNYDTGGLGNMTYPFYTYSSNTVPYVSNVQRHVVFPHKKYLVIYDQMQTTANSTFQWLWHVAEPTAVVNTNGCSFTYTCTNHYNSSNVTVYVQHIVDPSLMSLKNIAGTKLSKFNPFTGENYFGLDNDTGPYYNSTVWIYNRTPTTNWHFLSVVFPVKWGQPAPTITRINDYTVRVQQGNDDDTISVDATTQPPQFSLNLSGSSLGVSRLAPPQNLQVSPGP